MTMTSIQGRAPEGLSAVRAVPKNEAKPMSEQTKTRLEHAVRIPRNYIFVMNIGSLIGADSFVIDKQNELRRASSEEIEQIKSALATHATIHWPWVSHHFWEQQWPHPGGELIILPEEDWRYHVIATELGNISALFAALDLAPVELEPGIRVHWLGKDLPSIGHDPARFFHVLADARGNSSFFVDISKSEIDQIREIHLSLQRCDDSLIKISPILRQIHDLKSLPHDSPLRFLGYFAIVESLLTHAPKLTDPYDSITRQVKKKLALLDHRWTPKIDYTPFGETRPDAVWTKLYSYRSAVAHGSEPRFDSELSVLVDREACLKIVKETTKAVIRQALIEPQLLVDLRAC